MTKTILAINQLDKAFAGKSVLNKLDLQLNASQRVAILGESGCGKSTLLRIIASLESADSGTVELQNPSRCQMVFQDLGLWPSHTALQQLLMAAKSSNISEPKSAAINLLESLGIQHIADRKPANLSGGEARRLAFARVLICSPELILLDEAFSSLDSKSRMQGIKLLKAVLELTSAAVIMVTHNEDDAQQLDFPIYDMVGGHLIAR